MKEVEQKIGKQFPAGLNLQDRQVLQVLVTDDDTAEAEAFLTEHGIIVDGQDNPLIICKSWFRQIRRGERGKLEIRFSDKGPTMDINS